MAPYFVKDRRTEVKTPLERFSLIIPTSLLKMMYLECIRLETKDITVEP